MIEKYQENYQHLKKVLIQWTKDTPKTAAFIYCCILAGLSVLIFDNHTVHQTAQSKVLNLFVDINPSGYWFLILGVAWLFTMMKAGNAIDEKGFNFYLAQSKKVAFMGLSLALTGIVVGILALLTRKMFPSFGVASAWSMAMSYYFCYPQTKKPFCVFAAIVSLALPLSHECMVSAAIMGTYFGIVMAYATRWLVNENKENSSPLIARH